MVFIALGALLAAGAEAQTKVLRFPDVHRDKLVFSYAGDLWLASTGGGAARRLTAHPGVEYFAKFSPDGQWIAFTGQYDGDEQVYVMPAEGGVPKQLTFYPAQGPLPARWGYDNQVQGWTPDGKTVIFRSTHDSWTLSDSRLFAVPAEGGHPTQLPMPQSGAGAYSPDAKRIAYSPLFRDFRSWKRYQGGWAQDLYIFDVATNSAEQITNHPRTDRDPMWIGDKIYFASDRDDVLNLYEYDPAKKTTRQITRSKRWDVRGPSADENGQIVYEMDGELYVYNVRNGSDKKVNVSVPDDGLNRRPSRVTTGNLIEAFALSPKGQRAVIVARGDVYTVPIEKGPTRNLTNSSKSHEKSARWSPDGKTISYLSDQTGEEEIWLINQDGSGQPEQITTGGKAFRYAPEWSPDGKRLVFSDKDGKLHIVTLADKKVSEIADEERGQVTDYTWSHDGGHLAFSLSNENGGRSIWMWSATDGQKRQVTAAFNTAFSPTFDAEGTYLWYLSSREYQPLLSNIEFNFALTRSVGIFGVALRKDVKNAFGPESDEVTIEEEKKDAPKPPAADAKPANTKKEEPKKEKEYFKIDWDGLGSRVTRVPLDADNYGGLSAIKGHLIYFRTGNPYYGRQPDAPNSVRVYNIKERKESTLAERVNGYALSDDGTKALLREGPNFRLYDVPGRPGAQPKNVSTRDMAQDRVPVDEWAQIFDEVWRRFRDFFYVPNMHGYDWVALRDKYRSQLSTVGHRADLNYIISEMVAELNVGHAYIAGGDYQIPPRPPVALPGAKFKLDAASGRYQIARILPGENEEERLRSPLTEIGVNVKEGDYVLAIDGKELTAKESPYQHLVHKGDRVVTFTVNSKPTREGARDVTFRPITSEVDLGYADRVRQNREKVAKATNGRVGYTHIPDMGANGIREFIKQFYPQIRKEGMVVDVRGNGGGNVSQMLIERFRRTLLATGFARTNDYPTTYPGAVFHGALVCLLSETSASDGDIFPAMFKKAGLGPLIGKRSWGGVVGITNRGPLQDGGVVNVPEFGFASPDGQWIIEGEGVTPDIVVENDAKSVLAGADPQLERGIAELMKQINANPKKLPARPAPAVKTPK